MYSVTLPPRLLSKCIIPNPVISPELCLCLTFYCLSLQEPLADSIFKLSSTQDIMVLLISDFLLDLLCSLIVIQLKSRGNVRLRVTIPDQVLDSVVVRFSPVPAFPHMKSCNNNTSRGLKTKSMKTKHESILQGPSCVASTS